MSSVTEGNLGLNYGWAVDLPSGEVSVMVIKKISINKSFTY